eukprot:gene31879-40234_t
MPLEVVISLSHMEVAVEIRDTGEGKYVVRYTPPK